MCRHLIFQISYTLLTLNNHVNCIHGDFHLNNILIDNIKESTFCYVIEKATYVFKSNIISYVIDFGRSIINPSKIRTNFPNNSDLITLQIKKLQQYIQKILPEFFIEHKMNIIRIIKTNQDEVFKIFTALDIIYFLNSYRLFHISNITEEITEYIIGIEKFSIKYLRESLMKLIKSEYGHIKNINLEIIKTYFSDFLHVGKCDINFYNNYNLIAENEKTDIRMPNDNPYLEEIKQEYINSTTYQYTSDPYDK